MSFDRLGKNEDKNLRQYLGYQKMHDVVMRIRFKSECDNKSTLFPLHVQRKEGSENEISRSLYCYCIIELLLIL